MMVLHNIVFINRSRDTITWVMSLPIKTVMEYKAHNISLKYEHPLDMFSIIVCMWDQDCHVYVYFVHKDRSSYRNTDVFVQ